MIPLRWWPACVLALSCGGVEPPPPVATKASAAPTPTVSAAALPAPPSASVSAPKPAPKPPSPFHVVRVSTHRMLLGSVEGREMAALNGMLGDLSANAFVLDPKLMRGLDGHRLVKGHRSFSVYHLAGTWPNRVAAIAILGAFQLAIRWEGWRWRVLDRAAAATADKQGGLLPGDRWRIGTWRDGRVLGMHGVWTNHEFQILAGPPAKVPSFPLLPCNEAILIERAYWDASGDVVARAWDRCDAEASNDGKPLIARWSAKTGAKVEAVSLDTFNEDVPEPESHVFDAGGGRRYASRPNRLWESRDGGPYVEVPLPNIPATEATEGQVLRIDSGRVVGDEIWLGGTFVHPKMFWEMDFQAGGYTRYVILHTTPDPALPTAKEVHEAHEALTLKR